MLHTLMSLALALGTIGGDDKMKTVADWSDEILEALEETEISRDHYDPAIVLALIDVESKGDPWAHRPGSQFYGMLQMGKLAGLDVGLFPKGRKTTDVLHGRGEESIKLFLLYFERYLGRWSYEGYAPKYLKAALLWKAGARSALRVRDWFERGEISTIWEGAERLENMPNKKARVPGVTQYLERTETAWSLWGDFYNDGHDSEPEKQEPPRRLQDVIIGRMIALGLGMIPSPRGRT